MKLRNSFGKLGLMATFVALLFISCKKDDNGKTGGENDGKVGTATAMIKVDDQTAVKFESIPADDYKNVEGDRGLVLLKQNGNLTMFLTNDKNYTEGGSGIGFLFMFQKVSGPGDFALGQVNIDIDDNIEGNGAMLTMPNTTSFLEFFGTGEHEGKTGGGNVKVTSLTNDRIKGTFTISMYNMNGQKAEVSNGQFDLPLVRLK